MLVRYRCFRLDQIGKMMFLFPDTHIFLHFRDPSELPWIEVTKAKEITLVIGRTVQKEIEKKKFELRGRAQDRARAYARKLGDIVVNGSPTTLRESGPRLLLAYIPQRPHGWTPPTDLAPNWQDDQLIADALGYLQAHPDANVAILSEDSGVLATAIAHGLNIIRPGDDWALPTEATAEAKELEKLKRENAELRRVGPAISGSLEHVGEKTRCEAAPRPGTA